jgi:hypothetical protein
VKAATKSKKTDDLINRMLNSATKAKPIKRTANLVITEKKIRYTMDMNEVQHKFLKQFALDMSTDSSVVMRALLSQLERDAGLANKVKSELAR